MLELRVATSAHHSPRGLDLLADAGFPMSSQPSPSAGHSVSLCIVLAWGRGRGRGSRCCWIDGLEGELGSSARSWLFEELIERRGDGCGPA